MNLDMKPLPKEPTDEGKKKQKSLKRQLKTIAATDCGFSIDLYILASKVFMSHKPVISSPISFDHVLHVGYDSTTGEFTVKSNSSESSSSY